MRKTLPKLLFVFLLLSSVAAYLYLSEQAVTETYRAEQELPILQPDVKIVKQFMDGIHTVKVHLDQ